MKKFKNIFEQHREKGRFKPVKPHNVASVAVASPRPSSDSANVKLKEDLRQWFDPKHPKGGWKRINSKGEAIGPCAREPGEPKPKCMSNEKRAALSKKERASAVASKRKHDPNPERKGKPINVSNFGKGKISEDMENLNEKNVPTSPEKWAQAKAQAKAKFDVYPSAYANGWAAKKYKEMGGGWKSVSEAVKDKFDIGEYDQEGDMAKSDLRSIIANAQKLHDMIEDADNLPEWCQNKITLAEDYISTVANYLTAEMNEEWSKTGKEATHRETGEKTYEYHEVDKDGKPTGKREYRNAQGKPMGESANVPFDPPYLKVKGTVTDKSGAKHTPMSRARDLARQAAKKQSEYSKARSAGSSTKNAQARAAGAANPHMFESRKAQIVKDIIKSKKKQSPEQFQADPVVTDITTKSQSM